jgi:hypothetical protein
MRALRIVAIVSLAASSVIMASPAPSAAAGGAVGSSTFLGGGLDDVGFMVATDAAGNVYVTGWTDSAGLPVRSAAQPTYAGNRDAFVASYGPAGGLRWLTYLGGSGGDRGYYVRSTPAGTVSVTGQTSSTNFPTRSALDTTLGGGSDGFLAVFDAAGTMLTSTYLGGGSYDVINVHALHPNGDLFVSGNTTSANFPVTPGAQQPTKRAGADSFLARLDPVGRSTRWSTFLGGSGSDKPYGIAADTSGRVTVATLSSSTDFPVLNAWDGTYSANSDITVTSYTEAGAMRWSTYVGGAGLDRVNGLDVDTSGNVYLAGQTTSTNYPTVRALQSTGGIGGDGFVTSLTADGAPRYSTYVGAGRNDRFGGVEVDAAGRAFAVGGSGSTTLPTPGGVQTSMAGVRDGYAILLSADGRSAVYGTYLGGADADGISSPALGPDGSLWITGRTLSAGYPVANAADPSFNGAWDATVTRLSPVT